MALSLAAGQRLWERAFWRRPEVWSLRGTVRKWRVVSLSNSDCGPVIFFLFDSPYFLNVNCFLVSCYFRVQIRSAWILPWQDYLLCVSYWAFRLLTSEHLRSLAWSTRRAASGSRFFLCTLGIFLDYKTPLKYPVWFWG